VLYESSPTLLFYITNSAPYICIIGARGSVTADDWKANTQIPFNRLSSTPRVSADITEIRKIKNEIWKEYQKTRQANVVFYGTGHSLGGAICDVMLADKLVSLAVTYNPAIEPQHKHSSHSHRIYNEWDPLYMIMGKWATTFQVRRGDKKPRDWAGWAFDTISSFDPTGILRTFDLMYKFGGEKLYAHNLDRFTGGSGNRNTSNMNEWGPHIWSELHSLAKEENKEAFKAKLESLTKTLPCVKCRKNLATYLKEHPYKSGSTETYAWRLHNAVNKDLGKPILTLKQARVVNSNALYGGSQCRTFTEADCNEMNGVFDPLTSDCFVQGEDLGSKDCDKPTPPQPIKPIPYTPGKPDIKPIPYTPGKPDIKPIPINPPTPDNPNPIQPIPIDPVPGTEKEFHPQCYLPDKVSEETCKANQKALMAKFDIRRNIVKAKIINENLRKNQGGEAGKVGSTDKCRFYVKEDGSWQLEGDTGLLTRCASSGSSEWKSADNLWDGSGATLIKDSNQKTDNYIRSRLTEEGWLDTKYMNKEVSKSEYLSRIPEWCRAEASATGKTGNCPPRDTPAEIYDKCVKEGFPQWTEGQFNNARDKLFKLHAKYEWNPTINYTSFKCVRYNGVSYQAKGMTPKGRTPPDNPNFWEVWLEGPPRQAPADDLEPDFSAPLNKADTDKFIADYGTTFQEFQRRRDETCNSVKDENEIKGWDEWWNKIGSKYNSPCQPHREGTNDPLAFNNTIVDLDRPVCRQWRADATNLTNMLPPGEIDENGNPKWMDYDHRIPQDKWQTEIDPLYPDQRKFSEDDKTRWVWRHETTTPRHLGKFDMPTPGGCDFPPMAGTAEGQEALSKMAPEECFQKQRDWAMLMKANKAQRQCSSNDITCNILNGALPFLSDLAINGLRDFIVGLIPGGNIANSIVNKLIKYDPLSKADRLDGFTGKTVLNPLVNKALNEILGLLKTRFNTSGLFDTSAEDAYLSRFDDDKNYPGYYDPVLEEDIPAQRPAERQISLMRRLIDSPGASGPGGKFNEHTPYFKLGVHPTDYDAIGYDVEAVKQTNAQGDFTPVRPPVATGGAKHSKYIAIADGIIKGLKDLAEKELKRRDLVGGAHPHASFEKHLISYGISPDLYLRKAREKAKAKGLRWNLLGFSDDEKHKLQVPNDEGRLIHFGSAGMGDHILYTLLHDPTAEHHRKNYLARATKIKGDWHKSRYSPNSLAIAVLW
jgi:hypothetical protein